MSEFASIVDDIQSLDVLVVDDKANMRRTIKSMLRSFGLTRFTEADDGDVAYRLLDDNNFGLVICDWNMPRMKGVQLLRRLRKDKRFDDLPFLMITGEVEEDRVAESIEAEVDAYIIKPFQIQTLEQKLIQIMTRRRAPSALDVQFKLAEGHRSEGDHAQAHRDLDQAARIRPRSPMLFYQRGLVFEGESRMTDAEKCFAMARQLGPMFIRAHDKLAHIYQARGRTGEVCGLLIEAAKISPNNANRQIRLGRALLVEKRYEEARKAFNKAMDLDRENENRKMAIAQTYLGHGMVDEAEKIFKRFVKEHPGNPEAFNRLGILLRRSGKHEEALKYYEQALISHPEDQNLHFNLARVCWEVKNREKAALHLRKALEIDPSFDEARILLSQMKTGEY